MVEGAKDPDRFVLIFPTFFYNWLTFPHFMGYSLQRKTYTELTEPFRFSWARIPHIQTRTRHSQTSARMSISSR